MYSYILTNIVLSFIIFCFRKRKNKKLAVIGFIIMLELPFVGMILYLTLELCNKHISNFEINNIENNDDSKFISLLLRKAESNKSNIVPIEDALILNDEKIKRKLIMDTLNGDTYQYLGFLRQALRNEDTETAHYAAVAVVEIKRKLTTAISEIEYKYINSEADLDTLKTYVEILKRNIESGLLDNRTKLKYLYKYNDIIKHIIENNVAEELYFEEIVNCNVLLKDYDKSIFYCEQYMKHFSKSEKPYLLLMKIYYIRKNKIKFHETLANMRNSQVQLQGEALMLVRFWMKGA